MVAVTFAPILNPKRSTCLYLPLSVQIFKYVGGSNIAKLWFKKKVWSENTKSQLKSIDAFFIKKRENVLVSKAIVS